MNEVLQEGIIVKTINYKETSKIIFLVTKQGLLSLEVKGANKLNGHSHVYANQLTKIAFNTTKHYFTSGKVLNNYVNIKTNIDRLEDTLSILEMSYTLVEHITDFELFYNFLNDILDCINESANYNIYINVFKIKVLYLLGIAPTLNKCVKCGTKTNIRGFVFESGGMKCKDCAKEGDHFFDNLTIKDVIKIYFTKLEDIKENEADFVNIEYKQVKIFVDSYLEKYIGYISKTDKVLAKLKK